MKNMKRFLTLFLLLVVGITIFIYQHQTNTNADSVKEKIGQSEKFTNGDINTAFDTIKKEFKKDKGIKLTELQYSEKESNAMIESDLHSGLGGWITEVGEENVIVVFSTFKTGSSVDSGWEPNKIMDGYSWTLIRDSKNGKWRVKNKGYA